MAKLSEEWDGDQPAPRKPSNILCQQSKERHGGGKEMKRGLGLQKSAKTDQFMSITYWVCCLLQRLQESRPMKALLAA